MLFSEGRERVAIVGFGGMGKTQIALELAHQVQEMNLDNAEEQWSVLWMPGQSVAAYQQAAMKVAQQLNLAVNKEDDTKEALREYLALESSGRWLVILDNLDDLAVLHGLSGRSSGLSAIFPQSRRVRTLITTRSSQIAVDIVGTGIVKLDVMTPYEAQKCLLTMLVTKPGFTDAKNATELVRRLSCLPLTIGQAAAYMNENRLPISAYLQLWTSADQSMITLLSRKLRDETHHSNEQGAVATTWIISFEAICREDAVAARLLSFIQWIDCKAIPKTMLPVSGSAVNLADSIGIICRYGFMSWREDGEMLDMHPLVHLALRLWPKHGQESLFMSKDDASRHLSKVFPWNVWSMRLMWRQYMPHALLLVKEMGLESDEEILNLGDRVAGCLRFDDRARESQKVQTLLVTIRQQTLPQTHRRLLKSQISLGSTYEMNGQFKEAIELLEYVVAIQKETLAGSDTDPLSAMFQLATAYLANNQTKEAIGLLERIRKNHAEILEETHPYQLVVQTKLAIAYRFNGQVSKAIELLEPVVAIRNRTTPETDIGRIEAQRQLANAYLYNMQLKDALKILENVVAIGKKVMLETDICRLHGLRNLATAYSFSGQHKKSIELLEYVVAIQKRTLAETDHNRLSSLLELAIVYYYDEQREKSTELLENLVAIQKGAVAETDPLRIDSQYRLAANYHSAGRLREAAALLENVVAVQKKTLAETDSTRLKYQLDLALVYQRVGQLDEATDELEQAVAAMKKMPDVPRFLLNRLAHTRQVLGVDDVTNYQLSMNYQLSTNDQVSPNDQVSTNDQMSTNDQVSTRTHKFRWWKNKTSE